MFRFTIRDLLWLMVAVGLGVGWYLQYRQHAAIRADYRALRADFVATARAVENMTGINIRRIQGGLNVRVRAGWKPPGIEQANTLDSHESTQLP